MAAKTDTTPYKGHVRLYLVGFIVATALFVASLLLAVSGKPTGWEVTWFNAVNSWPDSLYKLMTSITFFGSTWAAALSVIVAFLARYYRLAWRLALSIVGAYGVVFIAKHLVDRERPLGLIADAHVRIGEVGMGFPSGHATIITLITLTLVPYIPWKWRWTIPVAIVSVCLSRLYLGVHVPLDVIGGVALATAVVSFVRIMPQPLRVFLRLD